MSNKQTFGQPKQKRSGCVTLAIVGAVVGVCAIAIVSCSKDDDVADEDVEEVHSGHSYTNNHYVHGIGYYHAPFGGWFSQPYNQYDPSRGYYYGGGWHNTKDASAVTSSVPSAETVSHVNSTWRSSHPAEVSSRKSSIASSRSSSRGGFGSSFRSSSSS